MIVQLASYPRSGVTFLRLVIERLYRLPTWTLYPEVPDPAGVFAGNRQWKTCGAPDIPVHFIKTHCAELMADCTNAIHLIRDGRDAIVSQAHFLQKFSPREFGGRAIATISRELIEHGQYGLPTWGEHTLAWLERDVPRLTFDALVADPIAEVTRVVAKVAPELVPRDDVTIETFPELQGRSNGFFRSGKGGGWRAEWPQDLQELFYERNTEAMCWANGAAASSAARTCETA